MQPTLRQVPPSVFPALDDGHLQPELSGTDCTHIAPGTGPDHRDINRHAGLPRSKIQQEARGILDAFLYSHQERYGLPAVDDAVVVGKRQIHHGPDHDLAP